MFKQLMTLPPRTRSSTNAANMDLQNLNQDLASFITQYKQGHRETEDLVSSQGLKTREHVSHEAKRLSEAVARVDGKSDKLIVLGEAHVDDQARERFLQSLKYPGFNQRRNQVDTAYANTLKWVFVGDNDDDSDSDYSHYSDVDDGSPNASDAGSRSDNESHGNTDSEAEIGNSREEEFDDEEGRFSHIKWDSLSNWLSSTEVIYWISGKPGSGKTTLVKYVLEDERTRKYLDIWSPGCKIVSHYFWRPGSPMQRNLEGLFCSLLYQLLDDNTTALRRVKSSVSRSKDSHTDWSMAELRSALWKALDSYDRGVCMFLDGLDEICPENGTQPGIPEFLSLVVELSQRGNIKLCLASRPDPPILERHLSACLQLRLQDLNYRDLMAYAEGAVNFPINNISKKYSDDPTEIIEALVGKAEGVFLWLILATKSINDGLRHGDSDDILQERIDHLPNGLDSLYQDMWARVGVDSPLEYRQTAALYFKVTVVSQDLELRFQLAMFGFNLLDLTLATTCIDDEIFGALGDPSKLVCQDVLLQKCREVENKLNVYCFGLVDITPERQLDEAKAAEDSWYGHKYDNVFPLATTSRLQFIHRTASDFLTDTESGANILRFDTESKFITQLRILKAYLARLALFADHGRMAESWGNSLWMFREKWEGTNEWVAEDWDRLILLFEKLVNHGRLLSRYSGGSPRPEILLLPFTGDAFLNVLAYYGFDDQLIISRLKMKSRSEDETSAIMLSLVNGGEYYLDGRFRLDVLRELLRLGADPNWQGWMRGAQTAPFHGPPYPYILLQTPWQRHMSATFTHLLRRNFDWKKLPGILERAFLLHSSGAKLDHMVDMAVYWEARDDGHPQGNRWRTVDTRYRDRSPGVKYPNFLYMSIPVLSIVKLLTETVRNIYSRSGDDKIFSQEHMHWCHSLEQACTNYHSSTACRFLGKFANGSVQTESKTCSWYEATNERQRLLASRLMGSIEEMLTLPTTLPSITDNDGSVPDQNMMDSAWKEIFEWICDDESLNLKAKGLITIYERFEELGLMRHIATLHEMRTLKEWVKKHNEESQSEDDT